MSYSFTVRAATHAEAKAQIDVELEKVVQQQPVHAVDRAHAKAVAATFIDLLPDATADQEVIVAMHGSVSWSGATAAPTLTGASIGASAYLSAKPRSDVMHVSV